MNENFIDAVNHYYSEKITVHGANPKGVDWNGENSQQLRFKQLTRIINLDSFILNDLGCGYGALYEYLESNYENFSYYGYDISEAMIEAGQQKFGQQNNASFFITNACLELADYTVASGLFNVKLDTDEKIWQEYILATLNHMNEKSTKGFAFNALTSYSDYFVDHLFYSDPLFLFDYCKNHFSKEVALLHDYGLYEFTILVRKG